MLFVLQAKVHSFLKNQEKFHQLLKVIMCHFANN